MQLLEPCGRHLANGSRVCSVLLLLVAAHWSPWTRIVVASQTNATDESRRYSVALKVAAGRKPAAWLKAAGQAYIIDGPQNDLLIRNMGTRIPHLVLWLESFGTWHPQRVVALIRDRGTTRRLRPTRVGTQGTFVYSAPPDASCLPASEGLRPYAWDLGPVRPGEVVSVAVSITARRPRCWYLGVFGFADIDGRRRVNVRTSVGGAQKFAAFHA